MSCIAVISTIGDSYLFLADTKELQRIIKAASTNHIYSRDIFSIAESPEDHEFYYFIISLSMFCLLVVIVILVGHFILEIHVPKAKMEETPHSSVSSQMGSPKGSLILVPAAKENTKDLHTKPSPKHTSKSPLLRHSSSNASAARQPVMNKQKT
ncbi:unnamed protein product [Heligmosomoides polygyrus]|uniref:Neur_chan_memb domain-containing protein n=1 Tax=Heligmosomoides polygyrus TaxID=6339 RepID=A0A183FX77_HELPZ|nr:unnamed protein product [Heligmosomoides polygyrus]